MADVTVSPSALSVTTALKDPASYREDMTISPSVLSITATLVEPSEVTDNKTVTMNTKTKAVTEYVNFNFNSYAKFNDKYIALNKTGIYELGGSNDNSENIVASLKTGTIDTYTENINRLRDGYVTFRSDGDILLKSVGDEENERSYTVINSTVSKIHERRIKFQRGIKDRYFSFELTNVSGSTLDIDKLRVALEPVRKRR